MIRIGVTGHRSLNDQDKISSLVNSVLEEIVIVFNDKSIQVISPLAEGADRIVAQEAINNYGAALLAPLPLEIADYLQDFPSPPSRSAFLSLLEEAVEVIVLPDAGSRELCYQAAGVYVLDHCDVLLAVWDGEPPRGVGGTGEIVQMARQRGLPIAWVHTNEQITERITYENFNDFKKLHKNKSFKG